MSAWIDELATTLGLDPLGTEEADLLLEAARDVAHRVERRITPLSTFLLGMAVAGRLGADEPRNDALAGIVEAMREILPAAAES